MEVAEPRRFSVSSEDASETARVLRGGWDIAKGVPGLWAQKGSVWVWSEGRWCQRGLGWLKEEVWRLLERTQVVVGNAGDTRRFKATGGKVGDVASAIMAHAEMPSEGQPLWLDGGEGKPRPDQVMVFRDRVVDVWKTAEVFRETGEYRWVTYPREWRWFGRCSVETEWDPEAKAPVWERVMGEWACGSPEWVELRERFYGACLMPYREWSKILMEYGVVRAGKGTGTRMLRRLLHGGSYLSLEVGSLPDKHTGVELAESDVVVFPDVGELGEWHGGLLAGVLRLAVGRDEVMVRPMYQRPYRARYDCMPIIQSHYVLQLPNEQGGVTSKMLPLRFKGSWLGKEDLELDVKLEGEVRGVARRLAEAAVRLAASEAGDRWPVTQESEELRKRIETESNPVDAFLEWAFVRSEQGWVAYESVCALRKEWEEKFGFRLRKRDGRVVMDLRLMQHLEERSSWRVSRYKLGKEGGRTGLRGVNLRGVRE